MLAELVNTLLPIATVVSAVAAVFTLLAAVTRRVRLRRNAEVWLQGKGASTGARRQLMADLHTQALAQLTSYELVPGRGFFFAWLTTLVGAGLLGAKGWELGQSLVDHPSDSLWGHVSRVLGPYYLDAGGSIFLGGFLVTTGLMWLAALIVARRRTVADIIGEQFPVLFVVRGTNPGPYLHAYIADTTSLARVSGKGGLLGLCAAVLSMALGLMIFSLRHGPLDPTSSVFASSVFAVLVFAPSVAGLGLLVLWQLLVNVPSPSISSDALREVPAADIARYYYGFAQEEASVPTETEPNTRDRQLPWSWRSTIVAFLLVAFVRKRAAKP